MSGRPMTYQLKPAYHWHRVVRQDEWLDDDLGGRSFAWAQPRRPRSAGDLLRSADSLR
jgi:hypothetical protein